MIKKLRTVFFLLVAACVLQAPIYTNFVHAAEVKNVDAREGEPYTIETAVANDATSRKFIVTNLTATEIDFQYSSDLDSTTVTLKLSPNERREIIVFVGNANSVSLKGNANGRYFAIGSYNGYQIPVNYYVNGELVAMTTTLNTLENGAVWTAPKSTSFYGERHVISGSNYKVAKFRDTELSFHYVLENRAPYSSYVNYVDQDGTRLNPEKSIGFRVDENGGSFTPDATYTAANGNVYKLMSGQTSIHQAYEDGATTYAFRYQKTENSSVKPYLITIIYKNPSGAVLATKTQTVTKGENATFQTADNISDGNGVAYTRVAGEASVIEHNYNDTKRTYTVLYDVVKADTPYDITIRYVDTLSGRVLDSTKQNVGIDATVRFNVKKTIQVDKTDYVLGANQEATISHAFGNAQRVYNVYYNEKGKEVSTYEINVLYFDVTNNTVLYATKQRVEVGKSLNIAAPTEYKSDDKEFVLLSGQSDTQHEFYSSRRKYVYFYRDVKDTKNEDTVVENKPNGEQEVVNANVKDPIILVDEDGRVTIPEGGENGEDLVIDDDNNVVVDDNETPKANGKKEETSSGIDMMSIGLGIGAAILILAIPFVIIKKKKATKKED